MKFLFSISALLITALCVTGGQAKARTDKANFATINDMSVVDEQDTMRNNRQTPNNSRKNDRKRNNNVDSGRVDPRQRTDTATIPPHRTDTMPGQMTPGRM